MFSTPSAAETSDKGAIDALYRFTGTPAKEYRISPQSDVEGQHALKVDANSSSASREPLLK